MLRNTILSVLFSKRQKKFLNKPFKVYVYFSPNI
nr:MAG TPA: hypothetical protein [Bacteriophage sp.]